ncbi:MAG: hypothetical protein IJQ81_11185 [Oscillibacter sp.]|nr:hypothetical protein [Oscillibacter sp.]
MDAALRRRLEDRLQRKFGIHAVLHSKYNPAIPASADREYRRIVNAYMGLLKEALETGLPKFAETYRRERNAELREGRRNDSATDIESSG